jgi:hypothetical protein
MMKKSDNSEREIQINAELVNIDKFHCPECARVMNPRTLDKQECICGATVEQISFKGLIEWN